MAELNDFKNNLVPTEELSKVKEHIIGMMYLGLESSDDLAEYYGTQEVMHREMRTPKEREKIIRAITAEDIRKMARKIFVDKNLNLALVGPTKDEMVLKSLLEF